MRGIIILAVLNVPRPGSLIRFVRKSKGLSIEELAERTYINRTTLGAIERGEIPCSLEYLAAIKKALDIELLPFSERERSVFMDLLFKFNNEIKEGNFETAKDMQKQLSVVKYLPDDKELNIYFSLFECRLSLCFNDLIVAGEILSGIDESLEGFDSTQRYYYFLNKGTYSIQTVSVDGALDAYLEAYHLSKRCGEKNVNLFFNISFCYRLKGYISQSATFLEEACELISNGYTSKNEVNIYNALGVDYTNLSVFQRAKKMLMKALPLALKNYKSAPNDENKNMLGRVLFNLGRLFRKTKNKVMAIYYFDKALSNVSNDIILQMDAIYEKALTYIEVEDKLSSMECISKGLELSKGNERYTVLFKTLDSLRYPNDKSVKHIDKVVIPYLLEIDCFFSGAILRQNFKTLLLKKGCRI